jgi:hypothetical protein
MNAKNWKLQRVLTSLLLAALGLPGCTTGQDLVMARQALGGDAGAVASLRAAGPAGLEALLALGAAEPALAAGPDFNAVLDRVCAQKDCAASHLYWYTDLAAAREEARRSGRPILSLRLLGRLDEELSCANSRFFRTVLYADPVVSRLLRERFVLYWQSERPVPKVTIDYGDGRSLVGTVTGNSIHYVLDRNGRLVDALPGLYGPAAFRRHLEALAAQSDRLANLSDADFVRRQAAYHREQREVQAAQLAVDFLKLGFRFPRQVAAAALNDARGSWQREGGRRLPSAMEASQLAMAKSASGEQSLLRAVLPGSRVPVPPAELTTIIELHSADAVLDEASRRLVLAKGRAWVGDDVAGALARFESYIAEDSVKNEYVLHRELHAWLGAESGVPDLAAFDARVYSELFLTPASDPWLGLGPKEVFALLTPAER